MKIFVNKQNLAVLIRRIGMSTPWWLCLYLFTVKYLSREQNSWENARATFLYFYLNRYFIKIIKTYNFIICMAYRLINRGISKYIQKYTSTMVGGREGS